MKKIIALIPFVVLAAGALSLYFGIEHQISFLSGIGLVFISIGLIFVGFDSINKRRLDEYNDAGKLTASYSGFSVIFIGIFWCVLGLSTLLLGIFFLLGNQQNFVDWIKLHPTLPLLLGGCMLISYSLHEFLGSTQERSSILPFLGSIPKRIFSMLLILVGLSLCFLALIHFILPDQYDALMSFFSEQYERFQCSAFPIRCEE